MADILMAKDRQEPEVEAEDKSDVIAGLTVEARDERVHVWITPTFSVLHSGVIYPGAALSLEGFELEENPGLKRNKRAAAFTLRLEIGSFVLEVPVKAALEAETQRDGRGTLLYTFRDVENGEKDAIRRFIRAHLSGHVVTVDDVIRKQDMPTSMNGNSRRASQVQIISAGNGFVRVVRGFFNLLVTLLVVGTILSIGGFAVYERLTIVQGHFAAVTAPSIELRAPADGQMVVSGPSAGNQVSRDMELVRIVSPELEADLIRARSTVRAVNGARERGELAAIELQMAGNTIYAPCVCEVLWAPENGAYILEGDRLFLLARTDEASLRVEALVHVRDVDRLYRGQTAYINWPETDDISEGIIEYIALDNIRQARAGFPDWLRQDQSLVSIMITVDTPIDPSMIGHPVDVFVRTELSFWQRVLRIVRTAGRSEG